MQILQKGQRHRTERDLEQLVPLIKSIQFFKERDIHEADFIEIVNSLHYEYMAPGSTVFDFGSSGDKFYIILQGLVQVLIPIANAAEIIEELNL